MTATTTLHVGNLPFTVTEAELRALFAPHGDVQSVNLVTDRDTGRPSGFGFVGMDEAGAQQALAAVDGQVLQGRPVRVSPAQQRQRQGGGPFRR